MDALPDDWLDDLQPSEVLAAADSQWVDALPADLPAGVVLVHAQMLRSGPLASRLARLDKLATGNINQSVQAGAIDATRESVAKVRGNMKRNR